MPNLTNEDKESIEAKLEYIGLDLNNLPEFLYNTKSIEYRPISIENENTYKIYRYIPISKIRIYLTPTNRLNTIKEKYTNAAPIFPYINPINEEDIIRHTTFLNMIKMVKLEEIENVEKEQSILNRNIPFKVKFNQNYLWQIYYSSNTDTYFMLVPTQDLEYSTFFYLLKKQIEISKSGKEEFIYVPISQEEYSNKYLKKSEFVDLEKYLWLFTKSWPLTYEVYDQNNNLTIQIVGTTNVIANINSIYKIVLTNKEQANKFYKLLKALFILQTRITSLL